MTPTISRSLKAVLISSIVALLFVGAFSVNAFASKAPTECPMYDCLTAVTEEQILEIEDDIDATGPKAIVSPFKRPGTSNKIILDGMLVDADTVQGPINPDLPRKIDEDEMVENELS